MIKTKKPHMIKDEMLAALQDDPEVQRSIIQFTRYEFADKTQTEGRFEQLLEELRQERIEQSRKWDEQNQKWREHQAEDKQKWEKQEQKWEKQEQKWEEQKLEWHEHLADDRRKWDEDKRKWDEQNQKWEKNQQVIDKLLQDVTKLAQKHDSTIGALGARWGLHTEASFRNALRSILEESFGVRVLNITEFDEKGDVFGRPDQVELDVIIQNGLVIVCEIKSSMSRGDVYIFDRKVTFYETLHNRQATRKMIISPMVEESARRVAIKLGIEVHSYAEDVRL